MIELLVVIVIIGILAGMGIAQYKQTVYKAQEAKALAEMAQIKKAIRLLEVETGKTIGGFSIGTCVQNPEFKMVGCAGGLLCKEEVAKPTNSGQEFDFGKKWAGPYIDKSVLIDPWGTPYEFDWDFVCYNNPKYAQKECNGKSVISAIMSYGPDRSGSYKDNIIIPFCVPK
ncbi:hypothetical protein CSB37_02185 [bacterium DOLZORAL124_38_8]|nr:MAG: hypothetical protein CSB37_02185 [bacterium DOLZORAL124_38_8]